MKSIKSLCEEKLKLNLQLFAEGDGEGGQEGQGTEQPITFASQADFDSAVDKRTAKALETAQAKWQAQLEEEREKAMTEGQRMAQMTEEERKKEQAEKEAKANAQREADLTRRELRLTALEELTTRNLPKELIEAVVLTDAEQCTSSIVAIETAFRTAVEAGVNERLKNSASAPHVGAENGGQTEKGSIGKRIAQQNTQTEQKSNFF